MIWWYLLGLLIAAFGAAACVLAVRENGRGYDEVEADFSVPGERHFYEWLSGGAEEGELLEAAVSDAGFTDFYRLKVWKKRVVRRERFDRAAFCLQSGDFAALAKLLRENGGRGRR